MITENKWFYKIIVLISFFTMVMFDGLACFFPVKGKSASLKIAQMYPNLFLPSRYTFSIWIFIFLLLTLFVFYLTGIIPDQKKKTEPDRILQIQLIFTLSCILNIGWIISWNFNYLALSIMLAIIFSMCIGGIIFLTNRDELTLREKFMIRLPVSIYYGWITYTIAADVIMLLISIGWKEIKSPKGLWTIATLGILTIAVLYITYRLKNAIYCITIIWALTGILVRHVSPKELNGDYPGIIAAIIVCILLLGGEAGYLLLLRKKDRYPV